MTENDNETEGTTSDEATDSEYFSEIDVDPAFVDRLRRSAEDVRELGYGEIADRLERAADRAEEALSDE